MLYAWLKWSPKMGQKSSVLEETQVVTSNSKKLNICFVAHFSYAALTGSIKGHIGGVERQTVLMARWLARRGHKVAVLTWDEGQDTDRVVDGIRILKMCRLDKGVPGIRFFYPRWSSLISAMRRADADIYYHNCGEYVTGQVAMWCRLNRKRFIYSVASDPDCDPKLPKMNALYEARLYKVGLYLADHIIVQTRQQQDALYNGFGYESQVLSMPCDVSDIKKSGEKLTKKLDSGCVRVLWVGRIAPVKQLEFLLDVAEGLPKVIFDVVGGQDCEHDYYRELMNKAKALDNVHIHGKKLGGELGELYEQAMILCCTSVYEGFPNTFLEAWSYGLPIVSTVNPDLVLERERLGVFVKNVAEMIAAIKKLVVSEDYLTEVSGRAKEYFSAHYDVDTAMGKFEQVLSTVNH